MSKTKMAQSEATRHKLVLVGKRLFARHGFDAVSAEQIVAAAGVTRGALYHHFDGKEGLFRAVLREMMDVVHARLERAASAAATPLKALELGIQSFLATCTEPAFQRVLLVDGPAVLGWHEWRALDLEFGLGLLRRGLGAAAAAGQLSVPDVDTTTHLLAGALIDGAMLVGREPRDVSVRRQVEASLLRLVHGLSPARDKG